MTDRAAPIGRIVALDIIRGAVMVLMAIDHVRVYSGQPPGGPTAGIFFTRWVTHFCAPAFVFLAGTGAFLRGRKLADASALSRYLATRGLMLVLLELTVIRFSWTFNVDYAHFVLAGVIWMIGWCMVLMAGLVRLSVKTVGIIGVAVMLAQQVFGLIPRALPPSVRASIAPVWNFFYPTGVQGWDGISILYTIVPWIGVMAAGYAFGRVMTRDAADRRRLCLRSGLSATALYGAFAAVMWFVAPADERPRLYMVLDPPKYPASQPFLLMTLGPTIALIPVLERARGWIAHALATFGRVPLFYYLLHIPLIHSMALVVNLMRDGMTHQNWYEQAPYVGVDVAQWWSLPLLYLVFAIAVAILYVVCRWFDRRRA
jgi:uncharacterized membrane protein